MDAALSEAVSAKLAELEGKSTGTVGPLEALGTSDENMGKLRGKLQDQTKQIQKLTRELVIAQRKATAATTENESLAEQLRKSELAKERLESLCRELQGRQKAMKAEFETRLQAEEAKRESTMADCRRLLDDVSGKVEGYTAEASKTDAENAALRKQIGAMQDASDKLREAYDNRQTHMAHEIALLKQQHEHQLLLTAEEKLRGELMTKEAVAARTAELAAKEEIGELRRRFDSMMGVIDKSRESLTEFSKYRKSMDANIKSLTKENEALKAKALLLIDMDAERTAARAAADSACAQRDKLQALCRALVAERDALRAEVGTLKGDVVVAAAPQPPVSALTPSPDPASGATA